MRSVEALRRRVPRGPFARSVLTLAAGTGLAQVIVVLSAPVLTRLYSPADYGLFSVATSIMSILIAVTCLRYEFSLPLPREDETAANLLALAFLVNLAMSLVAFVALWLTGGWIESVLGAGALGPWIVLIALGQFGGGAVSILGTWAIRTKTFSEIAAMRMTQAIALVTVQVTLGVAGFGIPGLLAGDVAGRISGSGRLARSAWRTNAAAFRRVSRAGMAAGARRYVRFPLFSSPSALLNVLGLRLPLLAIVALFDASAAGRYALADRVSSIPLTLVAGAVAQVYLGEAAQGAREHPAEVRGLFVRTTVSLTRMAIVPAIVLAGLAPMLAGPVLGSAWTETGVFIAVLVPMYFVTFIATATGETLYVLERQDLQLVREVVRVVLLGGAVPLAAVLHLSIVGAIAMLSAAGCITYLVYGSISWYAIIRAPSHPHRTQPSAVDQGVAADAGQTVGSSAP